MLSKFTFPSAIFLLLFISTLAFQQEAKAIPEFARKYNTSCTTCHVAITKRNAFGEAFRRNGYILPVNDAQLVKEKPVKLGAEAWKEMWPDAIWPGELPYSFPIAAATLMRVNYKPQNDPGENQIEFDMPLLLNLIFGGAFGQDVAFFGEWSAYTAGVNARGLQRFFLQFNSVVGEDNLFNIRVGRFEPGITDGYTTSQRLTSNLQITIDYGPAGWRPRDPQSGIELNGIYSHHIYYAAGVVNGESKTIGDPGDQKDFYGRLAYMFGGEGFDGKDIISGSEEFRSPESSFSLGAYTYWGSRNKIPSVNGPDYDNKFKRYGADINLHLNNFDLLGGVILGDDDNPDNDSRKLKSSAFFVEGNYSFYPWLIGVLRFDKAMSWKNGEDRDNYFMIVPNITILYRANIRFSIEGLVLVYGNREVGGNIIEAKNDNPFQSVNINMLIAF